MVVSVLPAGRGCAERRGKQLDLAVIAARDEGFGGCQRIGGEPGADGAVGVADCVVEAVVPDTAGVSGEGGEGGRGVVLSDGEEIGVGIPQPRDGGPSTLPERTTSGAVKVCVVQFACSHIGAAGIGAAGAGSFRARPATAWVADGGGGRIRHSGSHAARPVGCEDRVNPAGVGEDGVAGAPALSEVGDCCAVVVGAVDRVGPVGEEGQGKSSEQRGP